MKLTLRHDDGREEVFAHITEAYLVVRQQKIVGANGSPAAVDETRSYSWGPNLRELVKECRQSLVELDEYLAEQRRAQRAEPVKPVGEWSSRTERKR